jgi:hypothetical protein
MAFQAGDRVVAESESTERPARYGTVREVVHEDPHARYRIEWDDGRTSVYTPAAGALQRAPETAKRAGYPTTGRSHTEPRAAAGARRPTVASAPRVASRRSEPRAVRRDRHSAPRRHSARPRCTRADRAVV